MADTLIRLTILVGIILGCLAMIGAGIYLAISVLKLPLLAILPIGLVGSFLLFVGQLSPTREGRRYE